MDAGSDACQTTRIVCQLLHDKIGTQKSGMAGTLHAYEAGTCLFFITCMSPRPSPMICSF